MLEQFRSLYPTGCLVSEVVQVYKNEFVVRAMVIIDGVTRATGIGYDVRPTVAEDMARTRALMVLGIVEKKTVVAAAPGQARVVDLSDLIAETGVQVERLGWTAAQGQNYLMQTYGKRGRAMLSEDELKDFLAFLKQQSG
jgi:hypothetical protein